MQTELVATGELKRSLEALLFVASESLSIDAIVKLTRATHVEVAEAIQQLSEEYADRGIVVREIAGGYRFASSPVARYVVEAYLLPAKTNLSPAAMETLAIVAYLQPVSKAEIEAVRGVNVDSVVATLIDRRFIAEAGRRDVAGRPMEYKTTPDFLESFSLRSLSDLPPVDFDATTLELPLKAADPVGAPSAGADLAQSGADSEQNGADSEQNGADSEQNGADSEQNGADSDQSGADSDQSGADSDQNGADWVGAFRREPEPSNIQP